IRVAAFPDEVFHGHVAYISPRVDEDSRTVKIRVDVDNPQGKLKFGMFINATVAVGQILALAIPQTAVQTLNGKQVVFVVEPDHRVAAREVELGPKIDGLVQVQSGLREGEDIVGQGSFILKNEFAPPQ